MHNLCISYYPDSSAIWLKLCNILNVVCGHAKAGSSPPLSKISAFLYSLKLDLPAPPPTTVPRAVATLPFKSPPVPLLEVPLPAPWVAARAATRASAACLPCKLGFEFGSVGTDWGVAELGLAVGTGTKSGEAESTLRLLGRLGCWLVVYLLRFFVLGLSLVVRPVDLVRVSQRWTPNPWKTKTKTKPKIQHFSSVLGFRWKTAQP